MQSLVLGWLFWILFFSLPGKESKSTKVIDELYAF
jgi:hypothetical protein